jgi:hypothetical protein
MAGNSSSAAPQPAYGVGGYYDAPDPGVYDYSYPQPTYPAPPGGATPQPGATGLSAVVAKVRNSPTDAVGIAVPLVIVGILALIPHPSVSVVFGTAVWFGALFGALRLLGVPATPPQVLWMIAVSRVIGLIIGLAIAPLFGVVMTGAIAAGGRAAGPSLASLSLLIALGMLAIQAVVVDAIAGCGFWRAVAALILAAIGTVVLTSLLFFGPFSLYAL